MMFVKVDARAAVAIAGAALLVVWAMVDPAGIQGTIDQITAVVTGAWEGASGSL